MKMQQSWSVSPHGKGQRKMSLVAMSVFYDGSFAHLRSSQTTDILD
jgi:hypothetical protein